MQSTGAITSACCGESGWEKSKVNAAGDHSEISPIYSEYYKVLTFREDLKNRQSLTMERDTCAVNENIRFNRGQHGGDNPLPIDQRRAIFSQSQDMPFDRVAVSVPVYLQASADNEAELLQQSLLHRISRLLAKSKEYFVKPKRESHRTSWDDHQPQDCEMMRGIHVPLQSKDLSLLDDNDLYRLITSDRTVSEDIQRQLSSCDKDHASMFSRIARNRLEELSTHRLGNYILQRLMERDQSLRKLFQQQSLRAFSKYSSNEYSSRVLQACVLMDSDYCSSVLSFCSQYLNLVTRAAPAAFLATTCITQADETSCYFLIRELNNNPVQWLDRKFFKRLLVSLIHKSSQQYLDMMYNDLLPLFRADNLFTEKYNLHIMMAFLEKRYLPALRELLVIISLDLRMIIMQKYFRLFLATRVSLNLTEVKHCLYTSMLDIIALEQFLREVPSQRQLFYLYIVLSTASPRDVSTSLSVWSDIRSQLAVCSVYSQQLTGIPGQSTSAFNKEI